MTRDMQGLTFKVHSPALYELLSVRQDVEDDARVFVRYTIPQGSQRPYWLIHYQSEVANVSRVFKSRDAAIALIADRRGL